MEPCGFAAFAAKPDELLARAQARGLPLVGLYGMSEVQAFFEHPAVRGAQVIGVDTERGARPVAFVTVAAGGGFDEEALREHCGRSLARFKVPVRIFAVDEFPTTKSSNGTTIRRAELRRMAEERLATGPAAPG